MKRLFIVGNDAFIVHAMRLALRHSSGVNLFGVIDGRRSVRAAVREAQPDIVVVDGLTDAQAGVEHLREIREEVPHALVLLLSAPLDHPALHEVLEAGAMACLAAASRPAEAAPARLVPNAEPVAEAPRAAPTPVANANGTGHAGVNGNGNGNGNGSGAAAGEGPVRPAPERSPLTPRELEILRAVAEGHTNARIGRQLWVTEQTVKFHLSNIYRKLDVSNRTEASRYALVNGLVALPRRVPPVPSGEHNVRRLVSHAG
jgi:DNA-binding NarL/FixJ family response regulator